MQINTNVFVVTGGGSGIGRQVVLGLVRRGARVAAVDLNEAGLAETARLAGVGERLTTHVVDVTDRARVAALADEVVATHGRVDGLLNVAGIIQPFVRVKDLDFAQMEKVMAVNFWGVINTTKTFLPLLLERPAASLVNVASMGAVAPVPGQTIYGASKAAVKMLTEGLYAELMGTSVAATIVIMGGSATDITKNSGVEVPRTDAAKPGTGMTLTSPEDAAAQIIGAMEKGVFRVVVGKDARSLDILSRVSPKKATETIAQRMKALLS